MRLDAANKKPEQPKQSSFHVAKQEVDRESKEVTQTDEPISPGTALAVFGSFPALVPTEFFKPNGSDAILDALEAEVLKARGTLDISTEKGRKAIASLDRKIASSKIALDQLRKDLGEEMRAAIGAINKEGGRVWDRIEALQKTVRQELDDYTNAHKERIGNHEAALKLIQEAAVMAAPHTVSQVEDRIAYVRHLHDRAWEEFKSRADLLTGQVITALETTLELAKEAEAQRIELVRLRAEEAERKEAARLQAIKDEAAAEERRKSEERERITREASERERQRIEAERVEAEARAKQAEVQRIEAEERSARELREAEERRVREAEYAEQKRVAAEQEAARQAQVAAERAEREKQAAIEAERQRVADEAERARQEQEKRERNKKHRKAIEEQARGAVVALGISDKLADALIAAIAAGDVPNVTINY